MEPRQHAAQWGITNCTTGDGDGTGICAFQDGMWLLTESTGGRRARGDVVGEDRVEEWSLDPGQWGSLLPIPPPHPGAHGQALGSRNPWPGHGSGCPS